MIKFFLKYGAVFYILNTIFLSIDATRFIGDFMFLALMGVYGFIVLINPSFVRHVILHKSFLLFLLINIINFLYFLLFHSITDFTASKYLFARFIQLSIISGSIYYNFNYFKTSFLKHISYVLFILVLLCLLLDFDLFSGRYRGIVWNPNALASFCVLGFGIVLLIKDKYSRFELFMLSTFLIVSLLTGSRGVLVAIPLAFFFKYGFSYKNILYGIVAVLVYMSLSLFDLDTSVNRFASKELFSSRLDNWQYGIDNFLERPFFGAGLDKYSGETDILPHYERGLGKSLTAHNGYISMLIQYGGIFASILFFLIFRYCFMLFIFFKDKYSYFVNVHLYVIFYTIIACLYETLITGINDFHTILFWISIASLSFYKNKLTDAG